MTASKTNSIALFDRYPNTSPSTLVMYNRTYSLGELSYAYYESALVVANQFDGQAKSDIFLLPYLALHNWGCSWGLNPPVSRRQRVM